MLSSPQIAAALLTHPFPEPAAQALVRAANRAGGLDNITAVVAHPDGGWMLRPHKPEPAPQLEASPAWSWA